MPISSWLALAGQALVTTDIRYFVRDEIIDRLTNCSRHDVPALTFGLPSSPSSPAHRTPADEVVAFTPSSADYVDPHLNDAGLSKGSTKAMLTSSTVSRYTRRAEDSATFENQDDEMLPDLDEMLEQVTKRQEQKEKQQRLAGIKAAALKAAKSLLKATGNSDDDFDIFEDSPARLAQNPVVENFHRKVPDARAVLNKTFAVPAVNKQRQAMLRRAGKIARPKDDVTETFVDFAGKTFKHAELRRFNAGAMPAGQKKGRDNVLSQAQMDVIIQAKHQKQISALQKQKEQDWGRVRALPIKERADMDAILEMNAEAAHDDRYESVDEDEDEDEDDEDFVLEGHHQDEEVDQREFSGEESEQAAYEEGEDEDGSETADADKTNGPSDASDVEDDEPTPVVCRKARASYRVALDSDDEMSISPQHSTVRDPVMNVAPLERASDMPPASFDLGGFAGSSVGFSQLFEKTQSENLPAAIVMHTTLQSDSN